MQLENYIAQYIKVLFVLYSNTNIKKRMNWIRHLISISIRGHGKFCLWDIGCKFWNKASDMKGIMVIVFSLLVTFDGY